MDLIQTGQGDYQWTPDKLVIIARNGKNDRRAFYSVQAFVTQAVGEGTAVTKGSTITVFCLGGRSADITSEYRRIYSKLQEPVYPPDMERILDYRTYCDPSFKQSAEYQKFVNFQKKVVTPMLKNNRDFMKKEIQKIVDQLKA